MSACLLSNDVAVRVADRVAASIGPRRYAMWFDRSARFDLRDGGATLGVTVPNRFVADWIGKHFQADLLDAARALLGEDVAVAVEVEPEGFPGRADAAADGAPGPGEDVRDVAGSLPTSSAAAPTASVGGVRLMEGALPLRHRLDDFVVGASNELAYAAANRVAELDAEGDARHTSTGPLFVHGGCGLGKTHLLQGLCRRALERRPDAKVLYTTGERFTNEYITAIRSNKLDAFRRRMRSLDVLAVDDVHFLANKEATQQEFLHCFDQVELGGARVVLASDAHPKLIRAFSRQLVSRFVRGLVVQVHEPDDATRRRLIESLARRRGMTLTPASADLLSRRGGGSVRELEGLLTKLHALASLQGGLPHTAIHGGEAAVGRAAVEALLQGEQGHRPRRVIQFDEVLTAVCDELAVDPKRVLGTARHKNVVLARALTVFIARSLTSMSYPELAIRFGRKTHSTLITAAQRMQRQVDAGEAILLPGATAATTPGELVARLEGKVMGG